ncbi:MAG: hypothetical protein GF344_19760 [Chitinivibrionales bacterium]|nr:hypothetical protein [Chitinivibrionales bacterium]MBD3358851.1 hypothetical protein [Chitinivibrionales bacterium]
MIGKFFIYVVVIGVVTGLSRDRSFYMGFTPWPYAATEAAVEWVYTNVAENGDIISHHIEEGVPWPEAYEGTSFSPGFRTEINGRVERRASGQRVVLSVNPINIDRDRLAPYRGVTEAEDLPAPWNSRALNSNEVKTAYLNYTRRMVEMFDPDYVTIGIEVNLLVRNKPELWPQYVELHRHVYAELKRDYPDLPISASFFCVPFFPEWSGGDDREAQEQALTDLEPYMDYVAFSVHPFMSALLCELFPSDYFSRLFSLTNKPIAVSESSYPAEAWQTMSDPVMHFNGTQAKQRSFVESMLRAADNWEAEYVVWWTIRDFDRLWENAMGKSEIGLIWRDTGLYGEQGAGRTALTTWREWYAKDRVTRQPTHVREESEPLFFSARANRSDGSVDIRLDSRRGSSPVIDVYDMRGTRVRRLLNGESIVGSHTLSWHGRDDQGSLMPSAVYLIKCRTDYAEYSVKARLVR